MKATDKEKLTKLERLAKQAGLTVPKYLDHELKKMVTELGRQRKGK